MPSLTDDRATAEPRAGRAGRADDDAVPRSVERVLDLLEIVVTTGPANLTAIAASAALTPTTALRYLRALDVRGYVARDADGRYAAGPTVVRLAAGVPDTGLVDRLVAVAQPLLGELARATGESAYLAIGDGKSATYVATAESRRAIRHVAWVGQQIPLDGTAVGAALADPGTVCTRTGAVEPDITAVSLALTPVGSLSAAVSVVGPEHRIDDAALREVDDALRRTVRSIDDRFRTASGRGVTS